MLGVITKSEFLQGFKEIDILKVSLFGLSRELKAIEEIKHKHTNRLNKIKFYELLPKLSFSVTTPKSDVENRNPRSFLYPQLRCVASYNIDGVRNRLTVVIGRLSEFPNWRESKEPVLIARNKVFVYLSKNFPKYFSVDDNSKITLDKFLSLYEKVDDISIMQQKIDERCNSIISRIVEKQKEMSEIELRYHLPNLNITIVTPDITKIKNPKNTITHPHLRCTATINFGAVKNRLNIYVGRLDEFKDGLNDARALEIAREKTFVFLQKNYPTIFSEWS